MTFTAPSRDDLRRTAENLDVDVSEAEFTAFEALGSLFEQSLDAMSASSASYPSAHSKGHRQAALVHKPGPVENRLNAWYVKTELQTRITGLLANRSVVLKDNIMLAGVPMMNGSSTLMDYVPEIDATVVARVLDAGARIVGKAHCEPFCLGGGSHLNPLGPVHNPLRHGYSAGGSSSGVAALVAGGEAELGIGGDQGGSVRMPAAFCGLYGLKPTFGLVPYTGAVPVDPVLDHLGPITRTVRDNAILLQALAGRDGLDPRQGPSVLEGFVYMPSTDIRGLRIGLLKESFEVSNLDPMVAAAVRGAATHFRELGAEVVEISVQDHLLGNAAFLSVALLGFYRSFMQADGFGTGRHDLYVPSFSRTHRLWRQRTGELSPLAKLFLLLGKAVDQAEGAAPYGKAINFARHLRAEYNAAFDRVDVLLMPTLPITAKPHPAPYAPVHEVISRSVEMMGNTSQFNLTGHPALTLPCARIDGLPVGLQLVAPHFSENTLYRAAAAYETSIDWTKQA